MLMLQAQSVLAYDGNQNNLDAQIMAAQGYMRARQWDYAGYEWRRILAQDPANIIANLGLARSLSQSGLVPEAIVVLENANKLTQSPELKIALANAYSQSQTAGTEEAMKAKQLYQEILQKDPFHQKAFEGLKGIVKKLPPEEKTTVTGQIEQSYQEVQSLANKALVQGQYLDAAKYYDILASTNRKVGLYNDYGLVQLLAGNATKSRSIFDILNTKSPGWRNHANAAFAELSLGRPFYAGREMEEAIALCEDPMIRSRLYNNLGYIYEASRKNSKAQYAYERAVELNPSFTKAQLNLGYIYQREREFERGVTLYKDILKREPDNETAWNQLGFTYELMHKTHPAMEAYKKALALNPKYKDAYYNMGTLCKKMNKMEQANKAFKTMSTLEFTEMENAKKEAKALRPLQSDLLKYVDLFFTEKTQTMLDKAVQEATRI